jgi:hypothetical protein
LAVLKNYFGCFAKQPNLSLKATLEHFALLLLKQSLKKINNKKFFIRTEFLFENFF